MIFLKKLGQPYAGENSSRVDENPRVYREAVNDYWKENPLKPGETKISRKESLGRFVNKQIAELALREEP